MRKNLQPLLLIVVLVGSLTGLTASAQDEFHQFSNKNGQKIEAKIVSITPDLKSMKIQRRDGQEFDMGINVLSLDDQLIVKKWIAANPDSAKVDYNLDVTIEKKAKTTRNERDSFYRYKEMEVFYEVTLKNRTREDLAGARADYVIIMENGITISWTSSGRPETFDTASGRTYARKSEPLKKTLPYNHESTFLTNAVEREEVSGDGNFTYGEDKMLGIIVRVIGANDELVGEYRNGESSIQDINWDQVKGREFASNKTPPAGSPPEPPAPSPPSTTSEASAKAPEWLETRVLESWPEVFQKGDTILTRHMPRWGQKEIRVSAYVDIDEDNTGGVIVACGGGSKGFSLFVLNDSLHFWSRKSYENKVTRTEGIEIPLSEIPAEEFKVSAEYTDSTLKLWVNDALKAEGPSIGLIIFRPAEGLSVGYDSENSSVGPAATPHPFRGSIRDVVVKFGE